MGFGVAPGVALAAALATEVLWVAHRRLPVLAHVDASGVIAPVDGDTSSEPLRVVALGDSTLTGPGLPSGEHVWIRTALGAVGRSVDVVSLAVSGSRIADVERRVDEAIAHRPHLVVVAVGCNDVIHGTAPRQFRAAYDCMLDRLTGGVPVVAVANIGDLGNVARVPHPLKSLLRWRARAFCSIIESVAESYEQAVVLDVTGSDHVFRDRSVFTADLFHPGEAGHAAWAEAALPGLRLAIERALLHSNV